MTSTPIIKLLAASNIGSRRQMAAAIKRGDVAINGIVVESFNQPVDTVKDLVTVEGKQISLITKPLVYLMLNKPRGVISAIDDNRAEKTVVDILPEKYQHIRLYPVGSLDKDSTGLILLTNDGELTFRLTHPRFEIEKEYLVRINGTLTPKEKTMLENGIVLEDGKTCPATVKTSKYPPFNYTVTIREGKKRQIRRMFAALGYAVLALKGIRFGNLRLQSLPEGEIRELTPEEVRALRKE